LTVDRGPSFADTIHTRDGKEIKGIVVEDYRDRLTLSTVDGEISVMKTDIADLLFDTEEENLIKLGEQAQGRGDYSRAYAYYELALKINPNSKPARDGMVFTHGYVLRKEESRKEADIARRDAIERYGAFIQSAVSESDELIKNSEKLRREAGIILKEGGTFPEIDYVAPDSPAHEAGMRRRDLLVAVWGRLTGYLPLNAVLRTLTDRSSLEVKCTIERAVDIRMPERGASLSMEFDGLMVSNVKEESPSFKYGLRKGDFVVAIDGESTRYMPLKKAIELMRRSKKGIVRVTIRREVILWRREGGQ